MSVKNRVRARVGLDDHPMLRRVDRVATWVDLSLVLMLVVVGPVAGWFVAHGVHHAQLRIERVQRAERHPVQAKIVGVAVYQSMPADDGTWLNAAPGTWTGLDGKPHTGLLKVPTGTAVGSVRTVWTDATGHLVDPPQATQKGVTVTVFVTIYALLLLGCGTAAVRCLARYRFDQCRCGGWEREWRLIEPTWSSRHPT